MVIGNRTLLPIKEAALRVSYSRDYVARLAREGKIAAAQINRQWYIDPTSLENFFQNSQLEMQARADHTREVRLNSLEVRELSEALMKRLRLRKRVATQRVWIETIVVVTMSLFAGVVMYQNIQFGLPVGATTFSTVDSQTQAASVPFIDTAIPAESWWNRVGQISIHDESFTLDHGIVLLPASSTASSAAALHEQFFSDPVTVTTIDATHGVVSIGSEEGTTTLPFIKIPAESTVISPGN